MKRVYNKEKLTKETRLARLGDSVCVTKYRNRKLYASGTYVTHEDIAQFLGSGKKVIFQDFATKRDITEDCYRLIAFYFSAKKFTNMSTDSLVNYIKEHN